MIEKEATEEAEAEEEREEALKPKSFITPEGHQKIADEIEFLWRKERPKVVDEVTAAAAQGDRSENAEYIYGKKRLREIDKRLQFLERRVKRCEVIDPLKQKSDVIDFGATVTIENEEGQLKTYFLVGEDEAEPSVRKISYRSPIGKSLLGKKPGDFIEVETPKGLVELTVKHFVFSGKP